MRLARLDGGRWVTQDVPLPTRPVRMIELTTGERGEPTAWLTSDDDAVEVRVPMKGQAGATRYEQPVVARRRSGTDAVGGPGAGWLRVTQGCGQRQGCLLEGAARLDLPARPYFVARRGNTWFAAMLEPFRILARDEGGWRPLGAEAARGISHGQANAERLALALDEQGRPVVVWSDGTSRMSGRAWDGEAWRTLPALEGDGPHGLTVAPEGAIFISSWATKERWRLDVLQIIGTDVSALPALRPQVGEWDVFDVERTRLTHSSALEVAVPARPHALDQPRRVGFRLEGDVWKPRQVPATLLSAREMPWGGDAAIAARSALAIHPEGARVVVWVAGEDLALSIWDGERWTGLEPIQANGVWGVPAVDVGNGRLCVGWMGAAGFNRDVFVRCRQWPSP
jgi:hypothetical protein